MCEIFCTFRFSRFLHVSFFKSSTFRFAGFTWRDGGTTIAENCQMLCRNCNRVKGGK
uniref:HNH endonuclease n=1 Tax=Prevotella sp. TaxID=59823 RepID=UPI0040262F91